jgi:hypothetical protein
MPASGKDRHTCSPYSNTLPVHVDQELQAAAILSLKSLCVEAL